MKREDEISIASCAYGRRGSCIDFEMGARWADKHPDVSILWHDISEEPDCGVKILAENDACDIDIYAWVHQKDTWMEYVELFGLKRWAYTIDLVPIHNNKV